MSCAKSPGERGRSPKPGSRNRENAVADPRFADFRYRDLSTWLIFDRDQIAEIVMPVREKLAS